MAIGEKKISTKKEVNKQQIREPMESTTDSFSIDKPVFMDLVVMCDIFTLMLINQSISVYFVLIAINMIAKLNDLTPIFRSRQLKIVLDQNKWLFRQGVHVLFWWN